jgi:hypothetical protein
MGHPVVEVRDLDGAQVVFNNAAPVLAVVCASHLPDGTAWDFMKELRERGIQTPFLVVSSGCSPEHEEERGFEYLPLPLRKELFDKAIRRMVCHGDAAPAVSTEKMPRMAGRPVGIGPSLITE